MDRQALPGMRPGPLESLVRELLTIESETDSITKAALKAKRIGDSHLASGCLQARTEMRARAEVIREALRDRARSA